MKQRFLILLVSLSMLAPSVQAGFLFGKKKPKVEPAQRVPELLDLVKNSPDESKRSDAVDELRKYDPAAFPEMIPVLLDVLQNDQKSSVRLAAVSTLSKYRPVSQEIGMALEQTVAKDSSMRVRLHARSSLLQYHWAGYHTPKNPGNVPSTKEPPLAQPIPAPKTVLPPPASTAPAPLPAPAPVTPVPVTPAPLPAPVPVKPATAPPVIHTTPIPSSGAQRMPVGPPEPLPPPRTTPILVPTANPNLQPTPTQQPVPVGPDLGSRY
jgi:hypothetical protein